MAATLFSPLSMGRSVTAVPHDSLKISSLEFSMFDRSPSKKRNRVYVERSTKMRGMIKFYTLDTSVTKKDKKITISTPKTICLGPACVSILLKKQFWT